MALTRRKQKRSEERIVRGDVNGVLTSFDYQRLEPTSDRDTVNYWKEIDTATRELEKNGVRIGECSFLEVAFKASKELAHIKAQAASERSEHRDLQSQCAKEKKRANEEQMKKISLAAEITIWKQRLRQFGDHTADCLYTKSMECIRAIDEQEKDLCNCGWYEIKTQV